MTLEICVDSIASALAAQEGGAHRIELCADLAIGGTTPHLGLIEACLEAEVPDIMLMIRPRAGDFLYEEAEIQIMLRNIGRARNMGVKGVVFGLLRPDGRIDLANTARLIEAARPMEVTFHRAFDVCRDPYQGLDDLLELGVDHLLTSGQAPNAEAGIPLIRDLVNRAEGQLTVMAGAGVRALNVARIVAETGVIACHTSAGRDTNSQMTFRHPVVHMGLPQIDDYSRKITDPIIVKQVMREMLAGHQAHQ